MQGSKNANSNSGFTSKVSVEFFKKLDLYFNGYKTIHFSNGGEHSVLIENSRYFHLDYFIPDLNLCIEFYGDFFHANPKIYKDPNKILNIYGKVLTVKEIWEKDKRRTELLKERGIKTIIVWESDYYKNKNKSIFFKKILKKCLQN